MIVAAHPLLFSRLGFGKIFVDRGFVGAGLFDRHSLRLETGVSLLGFLRLLELALGDECRSGRIGIFSRPYDPDRNGHIDIAVHVDHDIDRTKLLDRRFEANSPTIDLEALLVDLALTERAIRERGGIPGGWS